MTPTYTFMSKSTAKPGMFDALVASASTPPAAVDQDTDGVVAYQVSANRETNTVIVWITLDKRETLYDYLATPKGQASHTGDVPLDEIIETFEMHDLTPVAERLSA